VEIFGAPVQTPLSPIRLKFRTWEYSYSVLFRAKFQHDRYIISHLAAKNRRYDGNFYEIRYFRGLWYPPSPSPIKAEFGMPNSTLSCCFVPNFSSTGLLVWVCWLTMGQSDNAAKFDRIWPFDLDSLPRTCNAAMATGCFWHFGPRRYVLTWLQALNKKYHRKF